LTPSSRARRTAQSAKKCAFTFGVVFQPKWHTV